MCSIHKTLRFALFGCALAAVGGGCQFAHRQTPVADVSTTPLLIDEAMQRRDFERSTAWYANGDVVAGPDGKTFQTTSSVNPELQRVMDPAVAFTNVAAEPFYTVVRPPTKVVVYPGLNTPPSYNAQPPLKPLP